ncbi:SH3 domain-containing protein [Pseudomonas sp. SJZ131]|nr:SH3 domain-containing protein [Pseudomonas sp. SJZ131]
MRQKPRSWLVPLLILVAVFWFMGNKDTPPAQIQSGAQSPPDALVSIPATEMPAAVQANEEMYVSADKLNLRDQPNGKVVAKLKRGDKVQVFERKSDWVRISLDGQPSRWLSSKSLCNGMNCFVVSERKPPLQPAAQPTTRRPSPDYGSSCACSSGSVCIGPRGGRYCITSGGNKRYGV